jgi:hypothetical protein
MGCKCAERRAALRRAVEAGKTGDVRDIGRELSLVGRTLSQDVRSGALARAAVARLATFRRR